MFAKTGTSFSPWVVINGNNKDVARLEAMRYVLSLVEYPQKGETGERIRPDMELISIQNSTS